MGLDPRTPGSGPEPKADTQPLSHPGSPKWEFLKKNQNIWHHEAKLQGYSDPRSDCSSEGHVCHRFPASQCYPAGPGASGSESPWTMSVLLNAAASLPSSRPSTETSEGARQVGMWGQDFRPGPPRPWMGPSSLWTCLHICKKGEGMKCSPGPLINSEEMAGGGCEA